MNVHGIEISDLQITACLAAMKGSFVAGDITKVAIAHGVPEMVIPPGRFFRELVANRVADRLLQQQKRLGRIEFKGGKWSTAG